MLTLRLVHDRRWRTLIARPNRWILMSWMATGCSVFPRLTLLTGD